jgi:hypothetical protein
MVRSLWLSAIATLVISNCGCLMNPYSSDPTTRTHELINQSEDLRQIQGEWERFWFLDQPSHMTPERTNGGVAP